MYEREQSLVGIIRIIRTYIFISFSTTPDNVFLIRFLRILITIPIVISETWNIILEKEYISTQHWNALFFEATYHLSASHLEYATLLIPNPLRLKTESIALFFHYY